MANRKNKIFHLTKKILINIKLMQSRNSWKGITLFYFLLVGFLSLFIGCSAQITKENIVWPSPPEKPRIKFVEILKDDSYFPKSFFESLFSGIVGSDFTTRLTKPYGVAADSSGRIYVTDTGLGYVVVFDKVVKKVRIIGNSGQGRLSQPIGIAISDNMIFVSDTKLKRVFGYDYKGNLKLAIGQEDEFDSPSGLSYDNDGKKLYVVDAGKHHVRVYSKEGKFLFSFGSRGVKEGEFNFPTNIFVSKGKVYVMDTMNFRVQIFDVDGKYLSEFGSIGNRPGNFARPKGIAVDSEGHVYVVDAAFNNFQIFNQKGDVLLFVGSAGVGPGEFDLPAGIFIDKKDNIYVVDQLNNRVEVFKFLGDN